MRILRGQSNLEVSSKGFALFVVGLVMATFLGGALRTVLNSAQLQARIVSELKNRFPKHEFQIGHVEVLLSRGVWPALGLRIQDLTFKQDVCGKLSFLLTVPQATLPLDVLSLLHGKARLNDIEIDGGHLHLDYRDCVAAKSAAKSGAEAPEPRPPSQLPRALAMPRMDWLEAARFADGVELKNFTVTYEKDANWKLVFNSAYAGFGEELAAQAQVVVEKSLPFGTLNHTVELDMHGDRNVVQWTLNSELNEGHIGITGSLDLNSQAGLIKATFRQLPLRDLLNEAYQMGWLAREVKLKATWFSCTLKWEGQLSAYTEMPITLRACRVEGGYGRAELEQADLWLNGPDNFKVPAHVRITDLQLQPVVESLNRQVLPAVMSKLGAWSGALDITSPREWVLDGQLANAEIVFSNQSMMGKQTVESIHTQVRQHGTKISARADEVRLRDGEFAGFVEFDLGGDWRDGTFRTEIDKVLLSSSIQKLLINGSVGALKGQGQGTLSAGELSRWEGAFTVRELRGEGWFAENVQVASKFQGGSFQMDGAIKAVGVDSSWRLYPQVRAVRPQATDQIEWRDVNAKVEISKNGGFLNSFSAVESPGAVTWHGRGAWVRDGEFNGTVGVGAPKGARTFALHGERGSLSVEDGLGETR